MAHYDLYSAIGLSRSSSTAQLAQELDNRIFSRNYSNPGGEEELRIAREVLGTDTTRGVYDMKLDDPNAPDITVAALRELSAQAGQQPQPAMAGAPSGGTQDETKATGSQPTPEPHSEQSSSAPIFNTQALRDNLQQNFGNLQSKALPYSEKARTEIKRSSKGVIIGTAAVTALVCLLLFGMVSMIGGSGGSLNGAKKTVNELIALEEDDARSWMRDNVDALMEDEVEDRIFEGGDFRPFEDVVDYNEPQVGEVVDAINSLTPAMWSQQGTLRELAENHGVNNLAYATINDREGEDTGWRISLIQRDGDWLVQDIMRAENINDGALLFR